MSRLTIIAILVSMSLTMFLLESFLPIPFLAPGAKLGLSNIVTVIALYKLPKKLDTFMILLIRIILSTIFVGSPTIIMFSFGGGLLSFTIMVFLARTERFSVVGVSAAGGFAHNVGQILVASLVMESATIFNYISVLGICGVFTGVIIGIIANETLKRIAPINVR